MNGKSSAAVFRLREYTFSRRSFLVVPSLAAFLIAFVACGGGSGGGGSQGNSGTISLQLASSTVTVPAGGSIGHVSATISRSGTTGSVSLTVTGLPTGASALYTQPLRANSGEVNVNPGSAAMGTYPLTVRATDGVNSSSASLSLVINAGVPSLLPGPFSWSSTAPLISPVPDATHPIIAVKDPSLVFFNNLWHVYATVTDGTGWNMEYINFPTWQQAAATPYYMDATPGFSGYHAAPELFYFRPQNKWYLIFQSGPPQYSTNPDPSQPSNWTPPQSFFATQPANVPNWIDFWVICDSSNCYLFFSGDDGNFWRSQTSIQNFPNGFGTPVLIMKSANAFDLFEASCTYYLQGLNQYLTIIEALGGANGSRYFRAFVTDRLDRDDWTPISTANSFAQPFMGINNVSFDSGVTPWTTDISHGEMIRQGYDETLTIDPTNMQFLYQGTSSHPPNYIDIPWQLGLLH